MSEPRPISPADRTTAPFWDATTQRRLVIQRCDACDAYQHYPRSFCIACEANDPPFVEASGRASIVSFSIVHRAPHPAFEAPYAVALVRLDEGPTLLTNIVTGDLDAIRCDQRVTLIWEELPDGRALPLFTPEGT
jgi:uncharacterized OB-fold protein